MIPARLGSAPDEQSEQSAGEKFLHYVAVLRRRIWIFLIPLVLAPVIAFIVAKGQSASYEATATVMVRHSSLASSLTGLPTDDSFALQPDRAMATQAAVARAPVVAQRALRLARVRMTAQEFLSSSSVKPESSADLLDFKISNGNPSVARQLAGAYAGAFTRYSNELQSKPIATAYAEVSQRLRQMKAAGQAGTNLYSNLLSKQEALIALQTLGTSNAVVVRTPDTAPQVAPRPKRAALLGFGLGLLIATALVFVVEAVDTRVRSADEIERALGLPLLARIPPKEGDAIPRSAASLSMLVDLGGPQAEAFRMLRTSLAFVALERQLQVLLVTSARSGDGKTTTAANLAVALARGGRNVIVADLDVRNPRLADALDAGPGIGLTEVAIGQADLGRVLEDVDCDSKRIPALRHPQTTPKLGPRDHASLPEDSTGRLRLLRFGRLAPPDPAEFVGAAAVRSVIQELRKECELLLVDSPPMLSVGDTLALSGSVDAVLVVVRATTATRGDLAEMRRLLDAAPVPAIGVAVTDIRSPGDPYGYGYSYGYQPTTVPRARVDGASARKRFTERATGREAKRP